MIMRDFKPYRGILNNWQVHHLDFKREDVIALYPEMEDIKEFIVITGTITDDPTGKYKDGHHYRSSLVVDLDRDGHHLETLNSLLHLGEEGGDVVCNPITGEKDMGNDVLNLFY